MEKSELSYLLEVAEAEYWPVTGLIRRAIERRTQDLAKQIEGPCIECRQPTKTIRTDYPCMETNSFYCLPCQEKAAHPVDNTPKGGGDVKPEWNRETMSVEDYQQALIRYLRVDLPRHEFAPSMRLVTLLKDYDAARADLKEAVGLFEKVLIVYPVQHHYHDEMDSFVKRVGKQP